MFWLTKPGFWPTLFKEMVRVCVRPPGARKGEVSGLNGRRSGKPGGVALGLALALIVCGAVIWMVRARNHRAEAKQETAVSQLSAVQSALPERGESEPGNEVRAALDGYDYIMFGLSQYASRFLLNGAPVESINDIVLLYQRCVAAEEELDALLPGMTGEERQEYLQLREKWHQELDPFLEDLGLVSGEEQGAEK